MITPPLEKSPIMTLALQEVLIVGSCSEQVKFSELTLDMFRMLQTLEREPQEDMAQMYDQSPAPGRVPFVSILRFYISTNTFTCSSINRSKMLFTVNIRSIFTNE